LMCYTFTRATRNAYFMV